MNQELTVKTAPLGHVFTAEELKGQCQALFGGIAYPGKNPGFGVVLALDTENDMALLDEVESRDPAQLIERCAALDARYRHALADVWPLRWYGDRDNRQAERFIDEVNAKRYPPGGWRDGERPEVFGLTDPDVLGDERPYGYLCPMLKGLLAEDNRRLFLKDSAIIEYLSQAKEEDFPFLEFGAFPAIEALAFAVHKAKDWSPPAEPDYNRADEARRLSIPPSRAWMM